MIENDSCKRINDKEPNVSRETCKKGKYIDNRMNNKKRMFHVKHYKKRMPHKDNENNKKNGFIFMEKGKSMFHVKHFLDKYPEK